MAFPFSFQRPGGRIRGLPDYDARAGASKELFMKVVDYLQQDFGVTVLSISNLFGQWIITVPDGVDLSNLPFTIATSPSSYMFASDVKEPVEAAFRGSEPNRDSWDSSTYDVLRPGVMLSSGNTQGPELLTTSGIQVFDDNGDSFITVASHGFPADEVYHPNKDGELIGHVTYKIPDADISLVRLCPNQYYDNETFTTNMPEGIIDGQRIKGIRKTDLRFGDIVTMDNPFLGWLGGLFVGDHFIRLPEDENRWVKCHWLYLGNDIEPTNGSCGSPILDKDGFVVSFFRFMTETFRGCGLGIAAGTLLESTRSPRLARLVRSASCASFARTIRFPRFALPV